MDEVSKLVKIPSKYSGKPEERKKEGQKEDAEEN